MGFLCRAEGGSTCYESFKEVLEIETLTDAEEADQRHSPTLRWEGPLGHLFLSQLPFYLFSNFADYSV